MDRLCLRRPEAGKSEALVHWGHTWEEVPRLKDHIAGFGGMDCSRRTGSGSSGHILLVALCSEATMHR
jgi:hypothetical protein